MEHTAKNLNSLLSVIREDDYLVVEHDVYGHVTELHPDDFEVHKELLRDALELASASVPW
jgi:hypothetical protein